MKTPVIAAALTLACARLLAQGTVNFANDSTSLVSTNGQAGPLIAGTTFNAALYYLPDRPNPPATGDFDSFDGIRVIGTSGLIAPGVFNGGTVTTPFNTPAGLPAWFQVRIWEAAYGASYTEAINAPVAGGRKALAGTSNILRVGQTGSNQMSAVNLTTWGLRAFGVSPVPLGEKFDFNDCGVPRATSTNGAAKVASGGAGTCVLHLTDAGQFQANGSFVIQDIAGGSNLTHIHVTWRSRIGGGTNGSTQFGRFGGDGYSFNWGTDVAAIAGPEGTGGGLSVTIDTWDNGNGEAPGLEIRWRGNRVAFSNISTNQALAKDFLRKNTFVDAHLDVDAAGHATFTYDGIILTATLSGWTGIAGGRFVFGAATSSATDNHWIDDVVIDINDLQITDFSFDPVVTFNSLAGHTYSVEKTASLNPVIWQPLVGNIPGTGGPLSVSDKGAGSLDQRHYRVRLVQ